MSGPGIQAAIREAQRGEADAVLAMFDWLFAPPGRPPPAWAPEAATSRLIEAIEGPDSSVLVADDGGELVGLCTAYLELRSIRFGQRCWVEDLAVDPRRRSQGIGERLLQSARDWARERGATHLELDTGRDRTDAQRFYERQSPAWDGINYAWWLAGPAG